LSSASVIISATSKHFQQSEANPILVPFLPFSPHKVLLEPEGTICITISSSLSRNSNKSNSWLNGVEPFAQFGRAKV